VGIEAGGHEGVYFGLRHRGKAVNPRPWLSRHH
jgi:septal ring factor EnvC (AmiA/AmiB activator)